MKLEIVGQDPWRKPVTPDEAERMENYVRIVESHPALAGERCSSCALRRGTVPNGSSMVAKLVDLCLTSDGNGQFMCHMSIGHATPCAGFLALTTTRSAT